jgi:tripeptide aminopeptidase
MNVKLALNYSVTERFLRYVSIDTQSDPESNLQPSTEKKTWVNCWLMSYNRLG